MLFCKYRAVLAFVRQYHHRLLLFRAGSDAVSVPLTPYSSSIILWPALNRRVLFSLFLQFHQSLDARMDIVFRRRSASVRAEFTA